MTYSIIIGETEQDAIHDYEYHVPLISLPGAPDLPGDYAGQSNHRMPGFADWDALCWDNGLTPIFYHVTGWPVRGGVRIPPEGKGRIGRYARDGIYPLTREQHALVTTALEAYRLRRPGAVPGWNDGQDPQLARLVWLEWWMRWALENCEQPAIEFGY